MENALDLKTLTLQILDYKRSNCNQVRTNDPVSQCWCVYKFRRRRVILPFVPNYFHASVSSSSVQADQTYSIIVNKRGSQLLHFYEPPPPPPPNFRKLAA